MPVWDFGEITPDQDAANADYAKIFKAQPVKVDGIFKTNPPSDEAALLVREATQNSWDSALEMREKVPTPPPIRTSLQIPYRNWSKPKTTN